MTPTRQRTRIQNPLDLAKSSEQANVAAPAQCCRRWAEPASAVIAVRAVAAAWLRVPQLDLLPRGAGSDRGTLRVYNGDDKSPVCRDSR